MSEGYLVAFLGAVGGAMLLGSVGFVVFFATPCDETGFECLGVAILSALVGIAGAVAGGTLGCWLSLRRTHHIRAGPTALIWLALLLPAAFALGMLTSLIEYFPVQVAGPINALLLLGVVGALPLAARWLALSQVRRRESISDGSSDIVGSPPS